ncbi:MAG TPA: hypothetical protein VHA57_05355 [Actinomycetota bacterium]|nr:hypothetical protein [Actinomycetota bacterium]
MTSATRTTPRRRAVLAGAALAAVYLVVAALSFAGGLLPRAPVLDGLSPPPPYEWVKPPPARVKDNTQPSGATEPVLLEGGSYVGSVNTPDAQCTLILAANSVPVVAGQTSLNITMTPIDASTLAPAPSGFAYDSNGYQISAAYEPSGAPVTSFDATLVLTYATDATEVLQWNGSSWKSLPATPAGQNQLFTPVTGLGTYATAVLGTGEAGGGSSPPSQGQSSTRLIIEIALLFGVVIGLLVFVLRLVKSRR